MNNPYIHKYSIWLFVSLTKLTWWLRLYGQLIVLDCIINPISSHGNHSSKYVLLPWSFHWQAISIHTNCETQQSINSVIYPHVVIVIETPNTDSMLVTLQDFHTVGWIPSHGAK